MHFLPKKLVVPKSLVYPADVALGLSLSNKVIKKLNTFSTILACFIVSSEWTSAQQKVVFAFSILWHQDSLQPIQASYPEYLCMYFFAFVFLLVRSSLLITLNCRKALS